MGPQEINKCNLVFPCTEVLQYFFQLEGFFKAVFSGRQSDTSFHAAFHSAVASQALRIELDTIIQQRIAIGSQQLMPTADSSADAAAVLSSEIMIDKLHSDVATRWSHMRQKEFIGNIEDALCGSANRREQSVRSSLQPSQSASLMKHSGCRKVNARKAVVNVTRLNR